MQEQLPYKMTPEAGWSKMETILKKEMPVYKSRRLLLFWWTIAAVFLLGTSSLFLFTGKNTYSVQPSSGETTGIISETETQSSKIDESASITAASNQSSIKNDVEINSSGEPLPDASKIRTTQKLKSKTSHQQGSSQNLISKTDQNLHQEINKIEAESNQSMDSRIEEETGMILNESIQEAYVVVDESSNERNQNTTDFLLTEIDALEMDVYAIGSVEPGKFSNGRPDRFFFSPYVNAGATIGFYNGIGADAGAGVDFNLTPRLSMNAGIAYQMFRPDVAVVGKGLSEEYYGQSQNILQYDTSAFTGIGAYIPEADLNNVSSNNVIIPFIESISQWQVRTGLKFDVSRRFYVEGGMSFGFATKAKSAYPIVSLDSLASANFRSNNSFGNNIIRSSNTSFYGGMGYSLNNHLSVYARYTHSIEPYFLTEQPGSLFSDRTDFIRGLNVGVKYDL